MSDRHSVHMIYQMVRYLTNKLIKYCNEEGLEMPTPRVHTFEQQAAKAAKSKKRKAGAAAAPLEVGLAGSSQGGPERLFASSSDDEMDVAGPSRPAAAAINTSPPKKRKKTKAYAPKLRSGPFAILVGLGSFGVDAWVTQEQIVERGDPFFGNEGASLTDKDNRLASNPAIGFSGWQSVSSKCSQVEEGADFPLSRSEAALIMYAFGNVQMNKTLVAKGLVEKKGRPLKYHITYEGACGYPLSSSAGHSVLTSPRLLFDAPRIHCRVEDCQKSDASSQKRLSPHRSRPA